MQQEDASVAIAQGRNLYRTHALPITHTFSHAHLITRTHTPTQLHTHPIISDAAVPGRGLLDTLLLPPPAREHCGALTEPGDGPHQHSARGQLGQSQRLLGQHHRPCPRARWLRLRRQQHHRHTARCECTYARTHSCHFLIVDPIPSLHMSPTPFASGLLSSRLLVSITPCAHVIRGLVHCRNLWQRAHRLDPQQQWLVVGRVWRLRAVLHAGAGGVPVLGGHEASEGARGTELMALVHVCGNM